MAKSKGESLKRREKETETVNDSSNQTSIELGGESSEASTEAGDVAVEKPELSREEKRAYLSRAVAATERVRQAELQVEQHKREASDATKALLENVGTGPFRPEGSDAKYSVSRRGEVFYLKTLDLSKVQEL